MILLIDNRSRNQKLDCFRRNCFPYDCPRLVQIALNSANPITPAGPIIPQTSAFPIGFPVSDVARLLQSDKYEFEKINSQFVWFCWGSKKLPISFLFLFFPCCSQSRHIPILYCIADADMLASALSNISPTNRNVKGQTHIFHAILFSVWSKFTMFSTSCSRERYQWLLFTRVHKYVTLWKRNHKS